MNPKMSIWRNTLLGLSAGAALAGAALRRRAETPAPASVVGVADLGGRWTLVDARGRLVGSDDLRGRWLLLYFGFSLCPDICPEELYKMTGVWRRLIGGPGGSTGRVPDATPEESATTPTANVPGEKNATGSAASPNIVPVYISVDSARDTLAQCESYTRQFDSGILALTGTPKMVQDIARKFRVYFNAVTPVQHSESGVVGLKAAGAMPVKVGTPQGGISTGGVAPPEGVAITAATSNGGAATEVSTSKEVISSLEAPLEQARPTGATSSDAMPTSEISQAKHAPTAGAPPPADAPAPELGPPPLNVDDDYLIDHSIITYLVNPEGEFVDFYGRSSTEDEMYQRIKKHIDAAAS